MVKDLIQRKQLHGQSTLLPRVIRNNCSELRLSQIFTYEKTAEGAIVDAVEKWATDGANPGPTKGNVTGAALKLEDVQYVVGSKWKQRYLVKNDQTGNLQFMDKQFNRLSGKWENYGQKNDWNTQCATCHTTGYRITAYDE